MFASVSNTFNLPVKPWMFKYASRRYGNPYIMDRRDPLSDLIFGKMCGKRQSHDAETLHKTFTQSIRIHAPDWYYVAHGKFAISQQQHKEVRKFLEKEFFDNLTEYVYAQQLLKKQLQDALPNNKTITVRKSIRQYFDRYGITDNHYEITHAERRYRMHLEKKIPRITGDEHKSTN